MSQLSDAKSIAEDDDLPLDFKSQAEEDAFMKKVEKERSQQHSVRRMTMMGGSMQQQGPQAKLKIENTFINL